MKACSIRPLIIYGWGYSLPTGGQVNPCQGGGAVRTWRGYLYSGEHYRSETDVLLGAKEPFTAVSPSSLGDTAVNGRRRIKNRAGGRN